MAVGDVLEVVFFSPSSAGGKIKLWKTEGIWDAASWFHK